MDLDSVTVGLEVTHTNYGRGNIIEKPATREEKMPEVSVYFYRLDEQREVPAYAISPSAAVTSIDSQTGSLGLTITIDDGFFTLYIEPDGQGTGYSISLHAGNAQLDSARLSAERFL